MTVKQLWTAHLRTRYPDVCRGREISGIDLMSLDAFLAGCVSAFVEKGRLDARRVAVLGMCYRDAHAVVSSLRGSGRPYFERLEALAGAVLAECARSPRSRS
jgi:hypothetical protein